MHVLRSERLGTLWIGASVLACLTVEFWRLSNPVEVPPLPVGELLHALECMEGGVSLASDVEANFSLNRQGPVPPAPGTRIKVAALDSAGWVACGLSPRQAASAVKYADAIGGIRHRAQLERMRVLPDGWLAEFGPALDFGESHPDGGAAEEWAGRRTAGGTTVEPRPGWREEEAAAPLDLNTADSLELIEVRGVGPWVAHRILRARRKWGGFVEVTQLSDALEGWDSLADVLAPAFRCSTVGVRLRCPDTLDVEAWRNLPGIGWREARILERFVHHHGGDVHGLKAHPVLDSARWAIVSQYLGPCNEEVRGL